ncbi:MAG: hypothetical protein A3I24_02550 [Candidatus Harrisonbacteria bacterium RIFCSPLOWO2_02_FULL_41_13b]|uniref:RNA polymerase subunit sigma-24 n=1 Tax=Candidatus Harrisonbacteria bacterium RIFCSPLOWO2_02_FULL_41_13b TaxID=1798409 RepID=A0A1G1ZW96_9BACT|nr:MAG: hypothetical protein A3J53_02395 [Candidatus Harrisonbacteria bacterium RIFCSPHIGHO2_02_FULL_40_20]OGY68127.1 MAG: hypothetical protein A3I24_02550 [Candidatus Harrisonbacteria bacterium RIFCSPLOWO2_02_FULL_41_13b]
MLEGEDKLIKRAQKGEGDCFGDLYDHYLPPLYRYILLRVSSKQEAEDLTHEVFVSAWENLKGYRLRGFPFSSWLYNIARNKVIDYYRTRKINVDIDEVDPDLFKLASSVEKEIDFALDFKKVKTAMSKLGEEQQDVLIMRFVDDLSHREIAVAMEKTEGAVRLVQHRALQSLREILEHGRPNN